MIRQIKLKCFRQHEDRVFNFAEGLNAIKGANEAGKSTVLEAALYALYGAKGLRKGDAFADVVMWDRKESELKVELTIDLGGRLFNFKRSKSGAEAEYDGGRITGQNEVSNFAAEIMGGDVKVATRLMLASQGNLRGALEEGSSAVATQIETLADFDLFDTLIEKAQEKWVLGSTATVEDRLDVARATLEDSKVSPPDLSNVEAEIKSWGDVRTFAEGVLNDRLIPGQRAADAAYSSAQVVQRMYDGTITSIQKAVDQRALKEQQLILNQKKAQAPDPTEQIAALKRDLLDLAEVDRRYNIFLKFKELKYPDSFWEGTRESLLAEIDATHVKFQDQYAEWSGLANKIASHEGSIRTLQSRVINDFVCPTCKREIQNKGDIEAQNQRVAEEIATLRKEAAGLLIDSIEADRKLQELQKVSTELKAVTKVAAPFENFAMSFSQYVTVDISNYPPKLSWNGPEPTPNLLEPQEMKRELLELEQAKLEREKAIAQVSALTSGLVEDDERIEGLRKTRDEFGTLPDIETLKQTMNEATNKVASQRIQIQKAAEELNQAQQTKLGLIQAYEQAQGRAAIAASAVKRCEDELAALNFNNALLKKIRQARPIIADKLWGMVLLSVSTTFSQMRGEKSVVTKDGEGFKVNGKSVSSLSGSTLDILGLAIRVALVKTFLPNTSFVSLDEPAQGCDSDRTASMLGHLAALGLKQIIIVSHEEATEAAADHVIQL